MRWIFLVCLVWKCAASHAQQDSSVFALPIKMDEVVVRSIRDGWDLNGFIRTIRQDTTFYKAFKSLRIVPYHLASDIRILDKKGGQAASLVSATKQLIPKKGCRTMEVLQEKTTGNFYDRSGDYRYYTAKLYAYLFFTKGMICHQNDVVAGTLEDRGKGTLEKSKFQLKQLLFNPGSKVQGVPLMGQRAAIFEPAIAALYDFSLLHVDYYGEAAFLFQAIPKPGNGGKVVYDNFSTWIRISDQAILGRSYKLSFSTPVYDFNVAMKVRLQQAHGKLLPQIIEYDGNWHVLTKGRERARFVAKFTY